jgi:putative sigma-54 modulation protein
MQIEVKGRNLSVSEDIREMVERRFEKVAKQVSDLAVLQIELCEERNPANPISQVAEATLHLKGVTLRARDAAREMPHAINLVADDISRQVKRHRDKRRGPRAGHGAENGRAAEPANDVAYDSPAGDIEGFPTAPSGGGETLAEAT